MIDFKLYEGLDNPKKIEAITKTINFCFTELSSMQQSDLIQKKVNSLKLIKILNLVATESKIDCFILISGNYYNSNTIVDIKRIYIKLAKEFTLCTLKEIGKIINKDHSTVYHSLKKHDDLITSDRNYKKTYTHMYTKMLNLNI